MTLQPIIDMWVYKITYLGPNLFKYYNPSYHYGWIEGRVGAGTVVKYVVRHHSLMVTWSN